MQHKNDSNSPTSQRSRQAVVMQSFWLYPGPGSVMMAGMARRVESQMSLRLCPRSPQLMPASLEPGPVSPRPAAPANAESHLPFVHFTSTNVHWRHKYEVLKTQLVMTTVLWGRNLPPTMKPSPRSPAFCHLIHWCLTFCSMWYLWRCMKWFWHHQACVTRRRFYASTGCLFIQKL